ncbi:hypothetical protein [Halomontanus rarus]|uniref:hypothetical protein n=1 Tax=Halomontanus rarus TaxID=3034020 RepID=UPI0023E7BE0F|nr:hypothetical protein [Halovivax sp. TS33]
MQEIGLISGTAENYAIANDVLKTLRGDHIRIGSVGKGTIFKRALQMRYAGHHAVDTELVEFPRDDDIDPELLNDLLETRVWKNHMTNDFRQDINRLGGLSIWHKDIGYIKQVPTENDTAVPLNSLIHEACKAATRRVTDEEGHAAALIRYWQRLNDAEVWY